jgi:GDP-4-dehydro-6-deoxy-D-mannose reductase
VVGALEVSRDFSDVRDIVRGYYLALTQGEPGEVYNLGSERTHTVRALLETLISLAKRDVRIVSDPERMRPSDVPRIVADCRKLRARTGWRAEIPFEQSLRDLLDYWRGQVAVKGQCKTDN